METMKYLKKHTRKVPCELCGVGCGSTHNKACKWAYISRQDVKPTIKTKVISIIKIVRG